MKAVSHRYPSQGTALLAKCTGGHAGLHLWMPLVTAGISSALPHGGSGLVFTVLTLSYRSVPLCPSQHSNLRAGLHVVSQKTEKPSKRLQTDLRPQTIFAIASTHPSTFRTRRRGEDLALARTPVRGGPAARCQHVCAHAGGNLRNFQLFP